MEPIQKGVSMMSTEDNKATVRRWIEEGGNQGNLAVFDELSAPNWVYHDPNFPDAHTLADYKRSTTEAHSAFPDFHTTIEDLIAEGGKAVEVWSVGDSLGLFQQLGLIPAPRQAS